MAVIATFKWNGWGVPYRYLVSTNLVGDVKESYISADHDGWVLLNGRAKSSLSAIQQSAATSLGFGVNIPNAAGTFVAGAGVGFGAVGTTGGGDTIVRENLPNVGLGFSGTSGTNNLGHTHKINPPSTKSSSQDTNHTHDIPTLKGKTGNTSASGRKPVPVSDWSWNYDWGSDQGGSGRTYPYCNAKEATIESSSLWHTHTVTTEASVTEGNNQGHAHTVDIAEFNSADESQKHTHTYSGTTKSMNGGVTQTKFIPKYIALNRFVFLGV